MRATLTVSATAALLSLAPSAWAQAYGQPPPGSSYPPAGGAPGSSYPPTEPAQDSSYPPGEPAPGSSQTEQELEEAERRDSGRGLEFVWLNAEVGVQHLNLGTFKSDALVDPSVVNTKQTGLLYGAGLGLRVLFLTFGARFRMGHFSEWQLWTLGAEVGLRIPLGKLEPYVNVGAGFASLGGFDAATIGGNLSADNASIKGFDVRLGGGLDYYVTPIFSIGVNASLDVVGLKRKGEGGAMGAYAADGTSAGLGVSGTGVVGLHF